MPKTLTEAPLTTREARAKLPIGHHFRGLDEGVHLMYKKAKRGGSWFVRWRAENGSYHRRPVGTADDHLEVGTLDFYAASKRAGKIIEDVRRQAAALQADGAAFTVKKAIETYISLRDTRDSKRAGRQKRSDAGRRLSRYVIGQEARGHQEAMPEAPLAKTALHALKDTDLQRWRDRLPGDLKASTRQRLINDLKAGLNAAYAANRAALPATLPGEIKHGLRATETDDAEPVARDNQILSDGDISRLLKAARVIDAEQGWEGDLFRLVLVLAVTGARFSQVARIPVGGFQVKAARLLVPTSRKGRKAIAGTISVPIGSDVVDELVAVTGRAAKAPLLERWRHAQAQGGIVWHRTKRGAWGSSSELVRPWRAIRERAGLPGVIPYALRHSSIVAGIRANLPLRLVAALHDTSTAMIERHYSRWITTGLEDLARAVIVPMVPQEPGRVIPLRGAS